MKYTSENIPELQKNKKHNIEVIVDRVKIDEKYKKEFQNRLKRHLRCLMVLYISMTIKKRIFYFFIKICSVLSQDLLLKKIEPRLFSFNSPNEAYADCDGLGYKEKFDPDFIIGNKNLSLKDGVILPLNKNNQFYNEFVIEIAKHCGVDFEMEWGKISKEKQKTIIFGDGRVINFFNSYTGWSYNKEFTGVIGFLENKLRRSDLWQREELSKYLNKFVCEECNGSRLKKEPSFNKNQQM